TKTLLPPATALATSTPEATDTPTPAPTNRSTTGQSSGVKQPIAISGKIARAALPAILRNALINTGVNDPKVYWFTFDEGSHEEALMIQYASPLRWQSGYLDMMRAAKLTLGRYYLSIDPPLYTAIIAATDLTGQSDLVVRLRRFAAEKWARGDIGNDDFVNNYFEFVKIVVNCTTESCSAKMATPFPSFNFPFPFPTPTPKP
ncbi:MAG TPA: hypothetical protein VII92_06590, partial [Anaerolineae bacterium]